MEWVVTKGRTIEEAKEAALDELGIDEADAEFEVLQEPKVGLFGKLRAEAEIRARVRPTAPRPKVERRDRRKKPKNGGGEGRPARRGPAASDADAPADTPADAHVDAASASDAPAAPSSSRPPAAENPRPPRPRRERAIPEEITNMPAQQDTIVAFVEGLVEAFDLDAQLETAADDDEISVNVVGNDLGLLIGPRGATLQAISDLGRAVLQRDFPDDRHARLRIDVAGYRERRKEALERFVKSVADEVRASGMSKVLEPMGSADRKIVHDTVNDLEGVRTTSEGVDPNRRVVILPDSGD